MTALAANKLASIGALEGVGEVVVNCESILAQAHEQVERARARAAEENVGVEEGKGDGEGDEGEGAKEEPLVPLEEARRTVGECETALSDAKAKLELNELDQFTREKDMIQLLAAARAAYSAKAARDGERRREEEEEEEAERRPEEEAHAEILADMAVEVGPAEVVEEATGELVDDVIPPPAPTAEEEKMESMPMTHASEIRDGVWIDHNGRRHTRHNPHGGDY